MDMTGDTAIPLQIDEDDLVSFKAWLAAKGVDPIIDSRIEVTGGSLRNLRHASRPGACRMETNAAGHAWRVWWSSGLYVQECETYRLVYRTHDEEAC
jgi:hypothetical protein